MGKSRDGPLATPLGCSGVSYFTRVRMCSHIHSLWMLRTLKIFVLFRDPQVCDFDKMLLFDLVAYSLPEGRELHDQIVIHISTTNIHYRWYVIQLLWKKERKKRKKKAKQI